MSKFKDNFYQLQTPEWITGYINYKKLEKFIKNIGKHGSTLMRHHTLRDIYRLFNRESVQNVYYVQETETFLQMVNDELAKLNSFYQQREEELTMHHDKLKEQVDLLASDILTSSSARKQLEDAFEEHYRALNLLLNFRLVNYTALAHLVEKFDRLTGNKFTFECTRKFQSESFYTSEAIPKLVKEVENIVKNLCSGDEFSINRILSKPTTPVATNFQKVMSGVLFGASLVLVLFYFYIYFYEFHRVPSYPWHASMTFDMFDVLLYPILMCMFIAINIDIWERYKVNYQFILEIDQKAQITTWKFLMVSFGLFTCWCTANIIYMWVSIMEARGEINIGGLSWLSPLVLGLVLSIWLFWPFNYFFAPIRKWVLSTLVRVVFAPFFEVKFKDVWLADQLTSLGDFLFQLQFVYCIYPSQFSDSFEQFCAKNQSLGIPILNLLPNVSRLMQCCRRFIETKNRFQFFNAIKYIISISVIILAFIEKQVIVGKMFWRVIWFSAACISSLYCFFWDTRMDWQLVKLERQNRMLRSETLYPHWWYYFATVANLFLRFSWIIVFVLRSIYGKQLDSFEWIFFLIILGQMFRRFLWNIFRLEVEQILNIEGYRTVHEMPLPYTKKALKNEPIKVETFWEQVKASFQLVGMDSIKQCCARKETPASPIIEEENVIPYDVELPITLQIEDAPKSFSNAGISQQGDKSDKQTNNP